MVYYLHVRQGRAASTRMWGRPNPIRPQGCMQMEYYAQGIAALKRWDTASLLRALAWWDTTGVQLMGRRDAYNAIGQIQAALRAR
jgi:hypothetical protein